MTIFVGMGWAKAHYDVYVEDGEGRARLPEGVRGIAGSTTSWARSPMIPPRW
jgi:hypothetical protein